MKHIIALLACMLALPAAAQTDAFNGFCTQGGISVKTQGTGSSNKVQGIIPSCTVTVFLTGTTTKATIYKDTLSTPLANPFTADNAAAVAPGKWIFYSADGQGYDVVMSGGIPPLTFAAPVTLTDLIVKGGGGGGSPTVVMVNNVPIVPASPANFVNTSTVTWQFLAGTIQATAGGGCPGTVLGDNTSTNCGFGNRVGDTAALPANIQTFGYTNLGTNTADKVITVGNNNGAGNISAESIYEGDTNWVNASGVTSPGISQNNIGIGNDNLDTLVGRIANMNCIGDTNCKTVSWADEVVAIGNNNFNNNLGDSSIDSLVAGVFIGLANGQNLSVGDSVVGVGQNTCNGDPNGFAGYYDIICVGDDAGAFMGQNVNNIITLGDAAATNVGANSRDFVVIGDGAGKQCEAGVALCTTEGYPITGTITDIVLIGDGAGEYNQGIDIVALGDQALGPSAGMVVAGTFNSGHDIVAIGDYALVANTTGINNIAIGNHAGSVGLSFPTTIGNANKTGSENVWIGDNAGPNTTSQLSNTIAIGHQAFVTASNQTVIGNASITQVYLMGVSSGCLSASGGLITGSGSACGSAGGGSAFSSITGSTNTTAAMVIGSGASMSTAGTGTNAATSVGGVTVSGVASNGLVLTATGPSAANWQSPGTGTVTFVGTGAGLSGGPITTTGTIILATVAPDRVLQNATGGTATPTGIAIPSCSTATSALIYNTSTHAWGCNSIVAGTTSFASITPGTNTTAAMLVGTGSSLAPTGGGTITPSVINLALTGPGGVTGNLPVGNLNSGVGASGSTCWHGDGTWGVCGSPSGAVCSGTFALHTAPIASASSDLITQNCTGLLGTDTIMLDFNADPTSTVGYIPSTAGMLTIIKYPTANTVNVKVVNNTANSITPGALSVNYQVVRGGGGGGGSPASIINVSFAPSGVCSAGLPDQQVASTGILYTCQYGIWSATATALAAGTVIGTFTTLPNPLGQAVDASGNILIASGTSLERISPSGVATIITSSLSFPADFAAPDAAGNVWVTYQNNNAVGYVTPSGVVHGPFTTGAGPDFVMFDQQGYVWVTNSGAATVTLLSPTGSLVNTCSTGSGAPLGGAIDAYGHAWTYNYFSNTVSEISPAPNCQPMHLYATGTGPQFMSFDPAGNLWIPNQGDNTLTKINPNITPAATVITVSLPSQVTFPGGTCIDAGGNVWVLGNNSGQSYIAEFDSSAKLIGGPFAIGHHGALCTVDQAGNVWSTNYTDGTITKMATGLPIGITVPMVASLPAIVPDVTQPIAPATIAGQGANLPLAYGTGAGTGPSGLGCASGHVCDSLSGTVGLTTGTAPAANGSVFTATLPAGVNHFHSPACFFTATSGAGGVIPLGNGSDTTHVIPATQGVALAASTLYFIVYICVGN